MNTDIKGFAVELLKGSHEIDRMRTEMGEVVQVLCGFIEKAYFNQEILTKMDYIRVVEDPSFGHGVGWEIVINPIIKDCLVHAFVNHGGGGGCSSGAFDCIPLKRVAAVHASLDALVDGVYKKFPLVFPATQPLRDAARTVAEREKK